jgi:hypothetical protein
MELQGLGCYKYLSGRSHYPDQPPMANPASSNYVTHLLNIGDEDHTVVRCPATVVRSLGDGPKEGPLVANEAM